MRLIDADVLKEAINKKKVVGRFNTINLIDNAPTVDVKPFATVTFDKEELNQIIDEQIIKPIKNGELLIKVEQPANEWISISEILPEQYSVLCCDKYGEIMVAHPFKDEESCTGFSAESENCYMFECVAWMPLPKPYKEDEE